MCSNAVPLKEILKFSTQDYDAMLQAAVDAYSAGQFNHAHTILVGLMKLDSGDARPVKLLASTLMLMERHRDAEAMYEHALALDGDDPYTIVSLAEIKLKSYRIHECLALFEQLFAMDPDGTHPAANRGRQLVQEYYCRFSVN